MRVILPVLLLLIVGCSKIEMVKMRKQTDADVITMVNRYRQAGTGEVESVLKDYLALADEYERKGWARYGAPGWIDELRSLCEARLAVFYKAVGKAEAYQTHVHRAIEHRKRVNPSVTYSEEEICESVVRLDEANIQPRWRKELSKPIPSAEPLVGKTLALVPRPLPSNSLSFDLQTLGRTPTTEEREVIEAILPLMQRHQVRTDYPLTSIRRDDGAKEWVLVFDSGHPDGAFTVFTRGKDADWFEMQPTLLKSRIRFPPERRKR